MRWIARQRAEPENALPWGEKPPSSRLTDLLAWQRLRGHMIFAPKPKRSGADAAAEKLYDYMSNCQARALDEEIDRLIYVALTRARRELHGFGQAKINSKGDVAPNAGSVLSRLWASVSNSFECADVIEVDDVVAPLRVPMAPSSKMTSRSAMRRSKFA